MKRKNFLILLMLIVVTTICTCYIILKSQNNILSKEKIFRNLFSSSNYTYKKIHYEDLIGLSTDGSVYDFYQYKIEGISRSNLVFGFPKYDSVFSGIEMNNKKFCFWETTPIIYKDSMYYFDIAFSANVKNGKYSSVLHKNDYLNKYGNYYSFISAYPIGTYLFIYSESEKSLFIIYKKG